jgi:hypothetical protein
MAVEFSHVRKKDVAAFVADLDPNLAPPAAADVFQLRDRPVYGGMTMGTAGNTIFVDFRDGAGAGVYAASADVQVWFQDAMSGVWTSAEKLLGMKHLEAFLTWHIFSAKCFMQVHAVYGIGAAETVTLRMMEV